MNANQKRILDEMEVKFCLAGLTPESLHECSVPTEQVMQMISFVPDPELVRLKVGLRVHLRTGSLALGPHTPVKVCALINQAWRAVMLSQRGVLPPKGAEWPKLPWSFGAPDGDGNKS